MNFFMIGSGLYFTYWNDKCLHEPLDCLVVQILCKASIISFRPLINLQTNFTWIFLMHHPISEIEYQNTQNVTEQISRQLVLWFAYPKKWLQFKIWNIFRYFILNVAANWLWMKTNCVVVKKKSRNLFLL